MNPIRNHVAMCLRKLGSLIGGGVPILEALDTVRKETDDESMRSVIDDIAAAIREGESMKTAMGKHPGVFSPMILGLIEVGEVTGNVDRMIMAAAEGIECGTISSPIGGSSPDKAQLTLFFRKLATLIDARLPLVRSLHTVAAETSGESMRTLIRDLVAHIEGGATFKEALARHPTVFAPSVLAMVEAGEHSETLEKALIEIARTVELGTFSVSLPAAETAGDEATTGTAPAEDPSIRIAGSLIFEAVRDRASDIHLQTKDGGEMRIRYRIDGVLHNVAGQPTHLQNAIMSRIKIMAGMNILEKRRPQDGRILVNIQGKALDIRVSVVPCVGGESVVMRLREHGSRTIPTLESQGFTAANQSTLRAWCAKPNGLVIVTGPAGCGKTTTLYTLLQELNTPDLKIMTVEDPVEHMIDGICQMQVVSAQGVTFAQALRSQLRQDPDVIMIGEIRDRETALMAIQAVLTGHLVLTSLHTDDAPAALRRLVDIGVAPFLVNSTVRGVLSQRLVRRVCPDCREEAAPAKWVKEAIRDRPTLKSFRGKGCATCLQSGYRGRVGIHELLPMDETIKAAVARDANVEELREAAVAAGMLTKLDDGMAKATQGITSIEEVLTAC